MRDTQYRFLARAAVACKGADQSVGTPLRARAFTAASNMPTPRPGIPIVRKPVDNADRSRYPNRQIRASAQVDIRQNNACQASASTIRRSNPSRLQQSAPNAPANVPWMYNMKVVEPRGRGAIDSSPIPRLNSP